MRYPNPRGSGQCLHKGPFPNGTRQDVESLWFPFRPCKTVGPVNEATATSAAASLTAPRAEPTCPIMGVSDFCPVHVSAESSVSDGKVRMVNGLRAAFEAKPLEDGMEHPLEEVVRQAFLAAKPMSLNGCENWSLTPSIQVWLHRFLVARAALCTTRKILQTLSGESREASLWALRHPGCDQAP